MKRALAILFSLVPVLALAFTTNQPGVIPPSVGFSTNPPSSGSGGGGFDTNSPQSSSFTSLNRISTRVLPGAGISVFTNNPNSANETILLNGYSFRTNVNLALSNSLGTVFTTLTSTNSTMTLFTSGTAVPGQCLYLLITNTFASTTTISLNSLSFVHPRGTAGLTFKIKSHKSELLRFIYVNGKLLEDDGRECRGSIKAWYGSFSLVPDGWTICNGTEGTPDLRYRFILGADHDDLRDLPAVYPPEDQGNISFDMESGGSFWNSIPFVPSSSGASFGGNFGALDDTTFIDDTAIIPPFYALYYIMKL